MATQKKDMKQIIDKVAHDLGDGTTQERLFAQKTAFVAHIRAGAKPGTRFRMPLALATIGVIAAGVLLAALWLQRGPAPLSFTMGQPSSPGRIGQWVTTGDRDASRIQFGSGSRIDIKAQTQARVVNADTQQVDIELQQGAIDADIVGNGSTRWHIHTGNWRITVLGTRFSVHWEEAGQHLDVTVFRGKVRVASTRAGERSVVVSGGNRFSATPTHRSLGRIAPDAGVLASVTSRQRSAKSDGALNENSTAPSKRAVTNDRAPTPTGTQPDARKSSQKDGRRPAANRDAHPNRQLDWLVHYASGNYREALSVAAQYGIDRLIEELDAVRLWKLQDAARITRKTALSSTILHRFRDRFPHRQNARVAAFLLGRIAMDKKQFSSASQWFNTYIVEDSTGPLSEEAHGLLIVVYEKMGKTDQAKQAAIKYLNRYQEGAFAKIARNQLN